MKAYTLIYSRTLHCDYPSGFLVRPGDLDVSTAMKYVITAMENIKYVGGIRHAVFPVGDYLIYGGIACVSNKLVDRILQTGDIEFSYKEYQADEAGRPLIFFMGFAIRKSALVHNMIPKIDLHDTYKIYLECLEKQWGNLNSTTVFSEERELDTRPYSRALEPPPSLTAGNKNILRSYREENFQQTIDYYFAQMAWENDNASFLSSVLPEDIARSPFTYISPYGCTAEDCVRAMKLSETRSESKIRTNNILDSHIAGVPERSYDIIKKRQFCRHRQRWGQHPPRTG